MGEPETAPTEQPPQEVEKTEVKEDAGHPEKRQKTNDTDKELAEPVKIGFKSFKRAGETIDYFQLLLSELPVDVDLNEYEFEVVKTLLVEGHPNAAEKTGDGVRAIQVRENRQHSEASKCFFVVRPDGSAEEFSYRKCLAKFFPGVDLRGLGSNKPSKGKGGGRGGRGGGRGGRGGRGGKAAE